MNKYIINILFLLVIATSITEKSSAVEKRWSRIWGSDNLEYTYGISTDNNDNIYVVGETHASFDGQSYNGLVDIFISKYNINGDRLWSRIQGSDEVEIASSVTVDSQNNAILAGYTYGEFNNQTNAGYSDNILIKFNSEGSQLWTRIFGSVQAEEIFDIATDSNDNIYVTGHTLGNLAGQTNSGSTDIFISKYSPDGLSLWTKLIGNADSESGYGIVLDANNNIYLSGHIWGELEGHTNNGCSDIYIAKLNPDGEEIWADVWGSPTNDYCKGIALDSSNNIYIAGYTKGTFAGQPKPGNDDFFLTKYSNSGSNNWTKVWGSWDDERSRGIAIDYNDNIFVSGHTWNEFDGQTNAGEIDVFLSKFNTDGERKWSKIWGSDTVDYYGVVDVDNHDNVYIAGDTYGEFDGQINPGNRSAFLTRFGPPLPFINITNSDFSVELPESTATISGTNNSTVSTIFWENTTTSGVFGVIVTNNLNFWTIENIPLVDDENIISVSGSNIFGESSVDTIKIDLIPEPFLFINCYLLFIIYYRRKLILSTK